jgi:hypothetical protein
VPVVVIGLPDTTNELLDNPTLVTVPPALVLEIVMLPLGPLTEMPAPALILVTPVLITVIVPFDVTGLPVTLMPAPGDIPTLVTVPTELALAILVILPYASTVTVG